MLFIKNSNYYIVKTYYLIGIFSLIVNTEKAPMSIHGALFKILLQKNNRFFNSCLYSTKSKLLFFSKEFDNNVRFDRRIILHKKNNIIIHLLSLSLVARSAHGLHFFFILKKHQAYQTLHPLTLLNETRAREDSNPRLMVPETIALSS